MDANKFFGIFSRMTHIRAQQTHINPTQNPKQQRPQTTKRLNERGNVFFTLFGAVAIVGVLGAGIMSTMRGPLSTMVEVNRREQAKAEARVAASLVLVNASDEAVEIICEGGTIGVDEDGYTEGPEPVGGGGPTGGGTLPAVGAPQNDPWGNAYGYCAWDHGLAAADYSGCGNYLAGNVDTNNIAIAVLSAGPNGVFNTTCVDHAGGYMTPNTGGGGDDIVVSMTYNQAIAGSGGLWNLKATDPNIAEINKNLEVTGGGKFTDVLDLTDAAAQLQLGEKSLTLPTQATLTTCNGANENLLRINTGPNPDVVEICNEDDGSPGSFAWVSVAAGANLWSQNGSDIYYGSGNVGIGLNNPNDALDVVGTAEITGATILGSTLGVTGATTLSGTLAVTGTSALNNDVTITGGATGGTTDALSVRDSSASVIFTVQNDGTVGIGLSNPAEELDVSGDIQASGIYLLDGTQILSNGDDTSNILLGDVAAFSSSSNYMNLGDAIHADLTTANKRVGIGFADTYDVSAFNDTLEVNGTVDISDTLNVTNDTTVGGDLTVSGDDITMATNTAGHIMVADGTNFNPVAMSGDVAIDGTGATTIQNDAVQEDDIDASSFGAGTGATCLKTDGSSIFTEACSGGGGGDGLGGKGLPDVLANDNDAAGANAIGFGGVAIGSTTLSSGTATLELDVTGEIGATEYCDADGNNCFTTGEMNQDIAEVLGVGNNAGGATSLINLPGLAIGSTVFSTGAQTLEVDITGDVGATNYCDADGNNCFTAATVSGGGGGIWENASNVVRLSSSGAHANADFVFGSPQLEDDGNASHDSRIYFDKSKGAFRAGSATGNQWNYSSSGQYSVALGYDTTASGIYSTATGYGTVASNNWSTAIGATTVASGMASTAMGATTVASGMASITMGSSTTASGAIATAMGFDTVASGSTATAIGESTVASGSYSIAMGRDVIAGSGTAGDGSGDGSIAMGLRSPPAPIGTKPKITGDQSLGIFMGDQDGGVVMSSSNTLGLFGGRMILDPNVPATELSTSTGGEQDLEMDITGDLGAINYCDEDGNDCFTAADIAALSGSALPGAPDRGIQFNSGGNFAAEANFTYTSAGDLIVGSYQLDDTGTGSEDNRMFFDVSKGAFRAGGVGGTQWDDGNVGTYSTAMGAATTASGYYSTATGGATSASGILSTAMGYGVIAGSGTAGDGAGDGSFAIGLTDETVTITTPSQITGIQSMGIFMGDQDGLVMSASNTMGLFGGKMIIDPAVPATQLAASTGGEQDLELDVTGDIGAVNYCDADGNNCFTPDEVGTGVFEDNSGVIRSTSGTVNYTTADFVFGSPQLADDGDANHTSRMFFDKSKGAFRAGTATGARWDDANVGTYSAAFGYDVTASGNNSFATGNSVVVSGYAAFGVGEGLGVTGTHAAAIGQTITSSGWASFGQGQFIYALGNLSHASGYEAGASGVLGTARGNYASALGWGSTAWGNHVTASGDSAYALGLIASATTITTEPEVTGNQSMGIFMGDQDGGVDLSDANTLGLFGGRMVIDPNVPATNLSADTALEVDGTIKMAYGGEACDASREGAIHYNSSDNKFYLCKTAGSWDEITTGTPSAAAPDRGIQFNSGGNFAAEANFTYTSTGRLGIGTATPATTLDVTGTAAISSTLGVTGATTLASTLQVDGNITDSDSDVTINDGLKVTGSADIDTNLNVDGNTTLPTGTLAVASSTASTGGEQDLELDVTGDIGATNYCDADGNNCFTAADIATLSGSALPGAPDRGIQFNSGGNFAAEANFTYTSAGDFIVGSYQLDDTGTGNEDRRMFFDKSKAAFRAGRVIGTEWDDANVGNESIALGTATTASGAQSVAIGANAQATQISSIAMGWNAQATHNNAMALGWNAAASGLNSTALGNSAAASGTNAVAIGDNNTASGEDSTAMGVGSTASGDYSTAMGSTTTASGAVSFAMGRSVIAGSGTAGDGTGDGSLAIGLIDDTTIVSTPPQVTGIQSMGIFMGDQDGGVVFASSSTLGLFGGRMILDPNVPATQLATSTGGEQDLEMDITGDLGAINYCDEDGNNCFTAADIATLSGSALPGAPDRGIQFNSGGNFAAEANFTYTSAGDLIVGSYQLDDTGTGSEDNRMFFDVSTGSFRAGSVSGSHWNYTSSGQYSVAMGSDTTASANFGFAMGTGSTASGMAGTALGANTVASGMASVAMGSGPIASGNIATAMGFYTVASGGTATAMGESTEASGLASTAMGHSVIAGSGTAGDGAGDGSFAIGLVDNAVTITTKPKVTGIQSMGIFMGDQDGGVVFASSSTLGLFGGRMVIDPNVPATNLAADVALDVTGAIKLDYDSTACSSTIQGAIRYDSGGTALNYCDGSTWQTIANGGSTGLWTDNTTHISYQSAHIIKTGETMTSAGFDGLTTKGMIWHTDKQALRAGSAVGYNTRWNEASIGTLSAAFGNRNRAASNYSFAAGDNNLVVGSSSAAFGTDNTTSGNYNFAAGWNNDTFYDASVALGIDNVAGSSTHNGYAFGKGNIADGYNMAIGRYVSATGNGSVAIGATYSTATRPIVSGADSIGIFMGDQSGVNLTQANTMAIMGGKVGVGMVNPSVELDVTGDIEYTGTITDVSDRRLKTDITPLDRAAMVERLMQVDTYSFRMKSDKKGQIEYGVMAQELEQIFPELVRTADDEMGTKSVNYVGLIAPMIETTKDLKAENDTLRTEIAQIKAEQHAALEDLRRDVAGLKAHTGYGISKAEIGLLMLLGIMLGSLGSLIITRRKT